MSKEHTCGKCGSENVICVEYAYGSVERYDGISEINCKDCGARTGRWTRKILEDGQVEARYGQEDPYVPVECKCGQYHNPKYPTCFGCFSTEHDEATH